MARRNPDAFRAYHRAYARKTNARKGGFHGSPLEKDCAPKSETCDLCGKKGPLCLDHDHVTGAFRGWLCRGCNLALGKLGDNKSGLQAAARYLNGKRTSEPVIGAFDQKTHYPLVHLIWVDHCSEDSWLNDADEALMKTRPCDIHTVGWLLKEDETSYLICNNIADDGQMTMFMRLLKGTVTKFEILANGKD